MKESELIEKYVKSLTWLREMLLNMDEIIKPEMGIRAWDDAVCIKFGQKKLLASVDGPYTKRLVMKSALIHAATDVIVKGGRPLFALDAIIGTKEDIKEMVSSLRKQAKEMRIPLLGGNTLFEDTEPRCSITVIGELLLEEPIRDSTINSGDIVAVMGEPIWGEQDERIRKAKKLIETWFKAIKETEIKAAKDVTKGGLASTLFEVSEKSGKEFLLGEIPYPMTRNMDNFLVFVSEEDYKKLMELCEKSSCPLVRIGVVK